MKKLALVLGLVLSCNAAYADTLTVAVAASLQYVFDDLKVAFKKESGHDVQAAYSSSGKLVAQIMHGAPFDVFLSADMEYPQKLHQNRLSAEPPQVYAYGALVLWTMREFDLKTWPVLLASQEIKTIALANPKTAPYGRETIKLLARYKLDRELQSKLVYGESIAQTNQYIHSKSADIGFTAKSVVLAPEMKGQGRWLELPKSAYTPIAQGAVLLKHGQEHHPNASRAFIDFMRSDAARRILSDYGYRLP